MKKENILIRFLKWIGIIKKRDIKNGIVYIPKSEMCKNAQNICDHNCAACAQAEMKNNIKVINADDIPIDDEWMQEDEWDEIYKQEVEE